MAQFEFLTDRVISSMDDSKNSFSPGPVRRLFIERVEALRKDTFADMPDWAREDPHHALAGKKIIICGARLSGEIRYVARHHEILAVVDDFKVRSEESYMGFPLITTDTWLNMAKQDPTIVSLLFVSTVTGYNHFQRCDLAPEKRTPRGLLS